MPEKCNISEEVLDGQLDNSNNFFLVILLWLKVFLLVYYLNNGKECFSHCVRNPDKGVEIAFLGTRTGLSRTKQFVPTDQLSNQWVPPPSSSLIVWQGLINLIIHILSWVSPLCLPETCWRPRTRRGCSTQITSLYGTRELRSRSPARLSTPYPSAQVGLKLSQYPSMSWCVAAECSFRFL